MFEECVVTLKELKELEFLLRSSDDMINPVVMDEGQELRHNQRENKLKRFEEQSAADKDFQRESLAALRELREERNDTKVFRAELLGISFQNNKFKF